MTTRAGVPQVNYLPQAPAPVEKRVAVVDEGTGQIEAASVQSALQQAAEGRSRIASQADIDNAITQEDVWQRDRAAAKASLMNGTMDPIKAYALNAWDEFTFGASSAALLAAGEMAGKGAETQEEMRRLRARNPMAYHLGGLAGGIGNLVATEGVASSLRAAKALEAAKIAEAARAAEAAGDTARAAQLAERAGQAERVAAFAAEMEVADTRMLEAGDLGRMSGMGGMGAAGRAGAEVESAGSRMLEIGDLRAAMRQTEAERAIGQVTARESELSGAAAKVEEALGGHARKAAEAEAARAAEAADAMAAPSGNRVADMLSRSGVLVGAKMSAAQGAAQGLHHQITSAAFGDSKPSFEDVAASMMGGALLGGSAHIASSLAGKGLASAMRSFSVNESEKAVARALQSYGVGGNELASLRQRFGSNAAIAEQLRSAGIDIAKTDAKDLFETLAKASKDVVALRNQAMRAGAEAGASPAGARVVANVRSHLDPKNLVTEVDRRTAKKIIQTVENDIGAMANLPLKERLARLDKLQSRYGEFQSASEQVTAFGSKPTAASDMWKDVKRLVRHEMETSIQATGNQTAYAAWVDANKAYSVLRTLDKSAARGLKQGLKEEAGVSAGTAGGAIGRAAMSTAIWGAPLSLLYDSAITKTIGKAAAAIGGKAGALAGQLTATQAARESFRNAVASVGSKSVTGLSGFKTISKDMEKYLSADKFDELVSKIQTGGITEEAKAVMREIDPGYESQAVSLEDKLRAKVTGMLPPKSNYLYDYQPPKPSTAPRMINSDQMGILRYLDAVADPLSVPMKAVAGVAGPEHVQALKDIFPGIYNNMVEGLAMDIMSGKIGPKMLENPAVRASISSFTGRPVSAVNGPEFANAIAAAREEEAKAAEESKKSGGGGGSGPPAGSGANYMTESERIEK